MQRLKNLDNTISSLSGSQSQDSVSKEQSQKKRDLQRLEIKRVHPKDSEAEPSNICVQSSLNSSQAFENIGMEDLSSSEFQDIFDIVELLIRVENRLRSEAYNQLMERTQEVAG